jgi:hypothetical protein
LVAGVLCGVGAGVSVLKRKKLNCGNLPDTSAKSIRQLSDEELHKFIAGWRDGTELRIRGEVELRRREGWVARWALGVSMFALFVSVIALFAKTSSAD